jgi:hypothetical protein
MAMHNFKKTIEISVPAYGTDVEGTTPICVAPFAGVVESVQFVPAAAITGADTNNRKQAVVNKGQSGVGSTEVAALTYASGVNGVAFDAKSIPNHATAANQVVAAGDVLAWASTAPGSGLADPGGLLRVVIRRSNS